ncbi:hypothetical protein [Novosphingobium sp. ZW T3_23]|uniref:hypothetical protein n=1 Tax=Novosphingobium sp. ZW T3_23 TaxID=3378084 RepID=UPI003854E978
MARATRTFKLSLSPAGLEVLIASHCRLIQQTRALLAWGTTLHVAVEHLAACPFEQVSDSLRSVIDHGLAGAEEHHLGAPHRLGIMAAGIIEHYRRSDVGSPAPTLGAIYLAALTQLVSAQRGDVLAAYDRVITSS